jgi:radical SAM family protein
MSEKIRRIVDIFVPVTACNLKCSYCYVRQLEANTGKLPDFQYSPEHVGKALSKKRLGGRAFVNICGFGETLLPPDIVAYVRVLLEEGHVVHIVSNMTLNNRIDKILEFPPSLLKNLLFGPSLHYLELKRIGKLDDFFGTLRRIRKAGCSLTRPGIVLHDDYIPIIEEIKAVCMERLGTLPEVSIARDQTDESCTRMQSEYSAEKLEQIAESFECPTYELRKKLLGIRRTEFCYSGDWSFCLNLGTGEMTKCLYGTSNQNIFKDISRPIHFEATGSNCKAPWCMCGMIYLAWGTIPEFECPPFSLMCLGREGGNVLSEEMKELLSHKLREMNHEYNLLKKWLINCESQFLSRTRQMLPTWLKKTVKSIIPIFGTDKP